MSPNSSSPVKFVVLSLFFSLISPISAFATDSVNFADYIFAPSGHTHSLSTGEQIRFTDEGSPGPGTPHRMYKNTNYEQFFDNNGIYRREDTSWAAPNWGDMRCTDGHQAAYTLIPCGNSLPNDGIQWLPSSGSVGQTLPSQNFIVLPIDEPSAISGNRQTCELATVLGYPSPCTSQTTQFVKKYAPGEFTFCTGITNVDDLIHLRVVSGPGAGDNFYYMKGWGMVQFDAPGLQTGLMGPDANSSGCLGYTQTCNLETNKVPPVEITSISSDPPKDLNNAKYKHPNTYPIDTGPTVQCLTALNMEETYDPRFAGTTPSPVPYTVREIQKTVEKNVFSTQNGRRSQANFGNDLNNPFAGSKQIKTAFTTYGQWNSTTRMTSAKDQENYKKTRFTQVSLFLQNQDSSTIDEQVAWGCGQKCFSLSCAKPSDDCRPITLSELAYKYQPDSTLTAYYQNCPSGSCPYLLRYPQVTNFQFLSDNCYQKLYDYLNLVDTGSSNSTIKVTRVSSDSSQDLLTINRGLPFQTIYRSPNYSSAINTALPAKSQTVQLPNVCASTASPPSPDKTRLTLVGFVKNLLEIIFDSSRTVKSSNIVTVEYSQKEAEGIQREYQYMQALTPEKDNQQFDQQNHTFSGDDSDSKLIIPDLGTKNQKFREKIFDPMLYPASWQRGQSSL